MSNLLSQASLVMIPSGYKEDVVYSQIPTNGSGDLSFTRASNGTRVNSAGLVEVVPWNLMQSSETFNLSPWNTNAGATITNTTQIAPNGTTSADILSATANTSSGIYQVITGNVIGQVYTASLYVKNDSGATSIKYQEENCAAGILFNAVTGAITGTFGTVISSSVENVGSGWYRIQFAYTSTNTTNIFIIYSTLGTANTFVLWGAQLNIGSTAKPYFPTTDRLNVPRLTYQNGGGGCPSLLLEKQSTNISYQSTVTSFGSGANDWLNGTNSPASINQTTGIDGTQNGAKYTYSGATTSDFFYKNQVPVTSGTTYTVSGYIKLGTASNAVIVINDTLNWNTVANGSIVCSTANGFSTTAWKRFELTITAPSSNKINIHYGYHEELGVTQQANGTFFLDGLQVEASSYATSLIPTTSASATRVADACFKTGISSLIGQTEGVMFVQFNSSFLESYTQRIFTLSDGTSNNVIGFQLTGANQVTFYVENSGVNQVDITKSAPAITLGTNVKIAAAYANNDFVFYINGTQIGTDTSGSVPATSQLRFSEGNASAFYLGLIQQVCLFKTRLTNAELASLTTI